MAKAKCRFKRGARVEAITKIHKEGMSEQAIGPRKKRWLKKHNEVIDAAESIRGGLAARRLAFRPL